MALFDKLFPTIAAKIKADPSAPSGGYLIPKAMMAHPAEPWPYGTVLSLRQDTFLGPTEPIRVMYIGAGRALSLVHPNPAVVGTTTDLGLNLGINWKPVPEEEP